MEKILFSKIKNKIVTIKEPVNGIVNISYGVVGGKMFEKKIQESQADAFYDEKIRLGYVDVTDKYEGQGEKKNEKKSDIPIIFKELRRLSKQIVDESYQINSLHPSADTINEANDILLKMATEEDVFSFNKLLFDLFGLLPRRMKNVIQNTAKRKEDFLDIIERENDLLQNLSVYQEDNSDSDYLGLTLKECSQEEKETIKAHMDARSRALFSNAWVVQNKEQDKAFAKYVEKNKISEKKFLFHGSRTENWWSIIKTGLKLDPVKVIISGKMFGHGIYFAPKAEKAKGYTSLNGACWSRGTQDKAYMGVYEVAYGKPLDVEVWSSDFTQLNTNNFEKRYPDKDCLHAHAGKSLLNDEIIIYNESACHIRYLVELKV